MRDQDQAIYIVYRVRPPDPEDALNGNGSMGFPVTTIRARDLEGFLPGYSAATTWCEHNLGEAGTYIIYALAESALPKFKLFKLEFVTPVPQLQAVPA